MLLGGWGRPGWSGSRHQGDLGITSSVKESRGSLILCLFRLLEMKIGRDEAWAADRLSVGASPIIFCMFSEKGMQFDISWFRFADPEIN